MKRIIALLGLLVLAFAASGCGSTATKPTAKYTLTIAVEGQGTVTPASGLTYEAGTVVTLTPSGAPGWDLTSWSGKDGASVVANKIAMDGDKSITAVFTGHPFLDLTTGSVWVYRSKETDGGTVISEYDMTRRIMGPVTFGGDPEAIQLKDAFSNQPDRADYTYFKPVSEGILMLGVESNITDPPMVDVFDPAPTLPTLKAGQSFTSGDMTLTALGTEVVTVPAGTFPTLKLLVTTSGYSGIETFWLGKNGIGMVKWEDVDGTNRESKELLSYVLN